MRMICTILIYKVTARCSRTLTLTAIKARGVAINKPCLQAALRACARKWQRHAPEKIQFLADNAVCLAAGCATDNVLGDDVIYSANVIRQIRGVTRNLVFPHFGVMPSISSFQRNFFGEREKILGNGLVVCKRGKRGRKEFAIAVCVPLAIRVWRIVHMSDDALTKCKVLLFCILRVENAIGFVPEPHASEEV